MRAQLFRIIGYILTGAGAVKVILTVQGVGYGSDFTQDYMAAQALRAGYSIYDVLPANFHPLLML